MTAFLAKTSDLAGFPDNFFLYIENMTGFLET